MSAVGGARTVRGPTQWEPSTGPDRSSRTKECLPVNTKAANTKSATTAISGAKRLPPLAHLPAQAGPDERPLTSEPSLSDAAHAPLTSEPPLACEAPLTSEPTTHAAAAAAGD
nr:hypothetical protein [Streptomyces sp. G1]